MGGKLIFEVNNGDTLFLTQVSKGGDTMLNRYDGNRETYETTIPAGDMVMLLNLYRYVKRNDIQNDFINPYGKNTDWKESEKWKSPLNTMYLLETLKPLRESKHFMLNPFFESGNLVYFRNGFNYKTVSKSEVVKIEK